VARVLRSQTEKTIHPFFRKSGIQTLPMGLIPFYGVGISGASHIMAFDLLRLRLGMSNAR